MSLLIQRISAATLLLVHLHGNTQPSTTPSADQIIEQLAPSRSRGLGSRNLVVTPVTPVTPLTSVTTDVPAAISTPPPDAKPSAVQASPTATMSVPLQPIAQATDQRPHIGTIDLDIRFDVNSASIRPESKEILQNLSIAMRSELLRQTYFAIEGHTDFSGRSDLNLKLSQARAEAVKLNLMLQGVATTRLAAIGKGSSEPINQINRYAAENRRVRIINLQK